MNQVTGEIRELKTGEVKPGWTSISRYEAERLKDVPEEARAPYLSTLRFEFQRKKLKAPWNAHIRNAYLQGYMAGRKDQMMEFLQTVQEVGSEPDEAQEELDASRKPASSS